jgi:glycosyltransferase involved in cell wall biosynthesis
VDPVPSLRIAFGTIPADQPGGIAATEHVFQAACERTGRVVVLPLPFGRRGGSGSALSRLAQGASDLAAFARLVRTEHPDLVHLDSAFDRRALVRDSCYALLARALRQPVFFKFHGSDPALVRTRSPLWRALILLVAGSAAGIGVLSTDEREALIAEGADGARIFVLRNAVPWRRFRAEPRPARERTRLLFLARLVATKGLRDTIRAVAILAKEGRAVTLDVVGDGPERAPAEALARELGVADRVRFRGHVPEAETAAFYLTSGMLVFPTEREGFSMTIFQALAAGLPILTTRVNAAADWLVEPDHVLWIPAGDPNAVAQKIAWLLDHPETAERMTSLGPARAELFDEEALAIEAIDRYTSLLQRSRGDSARALSRETR